MTLPLSPEVVRALYLASGIDGTAKAQSEVAPIGLFTSGRCRCGQLPP
jgi:hypothetical protein